MEINVTLAGTTQLLMHNEQLADPTNPIVREIKTITDKRKKTDEDLLRKLRLDFEGGLYWSPTAGPFLPTYNVKRAFVEGARLSKLGKAVERAFAPLEAEAALVYDGPRDIEGMWAAGFRDVRSVKIGMQRVTRCRPSFPAGWRVSFRADLATDLLNLDEFGRCAATAGLLTGIGDYRARYGRFTVEVSQ